MRLRFLAALLCLPLVAAEPQSTDGAGDAPAAWADILSVELEHDGQDLILDLRLAGSDAPEGACWNTDLSVNGEHFTVFTRNERGALRTTLGATGIEFAYPEPLTGAPAHLRIPLRREVLELAQGDEVRLKGLGSCVMWAGRFLDTADPGTPYTIPPLEPPEETAAIGRTLARGHLLTPDPTETVGLRVPAPPRGTWVLARGTSEAPYDLDVSFLDAGRNDLRTCVDFGSDQLCQAPGGSHEMEVVLFSGADVEIEVVSVAPPGP